MRLCLEEHSGFPNHLYIIYHCSIQKSSPVDKGCFGLFSPLRCQTTSSRILYLVCHKTVISPDSFVTVWSNAAYHHQFSVLKERKVRFTRNGLTKVAIALLTCFIINTRRFIEERNPSLGYWRWFIGLYHRCQAKGQQNE